MGPQARSLGEVLELEAPLVSRFSHGLLLLRMSAFAAEKLKFL